ncbi:MAG: thioesterase family protein [Thermoleophilia bacterium]
MSGASSQPGDAGRVETVVDESMIAAAVGSGSVRGLSTPSMIALMEGAAVAAIADALQPGMSSVGTRIDVRHLAPTPVGMRVVAEAKVIGVDRRRISFVVSAFDAIGSIGEGTHERSIIDAARFAETLKEREASI